MFSYRCPSCGKEHVIPEQPVQDLQSRCLRCQNAVLIPGRGITAAEKTGISRTERRKGQAGGSARPAAAGEAADSDGMVLAGGGASEDDYDSDGFIDALDTDEDYLESDDRIPLHKGPLGKRDGKGAGKRRSKKGKGADVEDSDDDISLSPGEALDAEDEDTSSGDFRDPKEDDTAARQRSILNDKPWWKRWQYQAGIGGGVLVVATVVAFFMFRSNKTTPRRTVSTKPPTTTKVAATPPTTKKATEPPVKPTPPPPPVEKKPDFRLSVARLNTEMAADPEGTDRKYKGRLLEVSGLYDRIESKPGGPPPKPGTPPTMTAELLFVGSLIHCQLAGDYRTTPAGRSLTTGRPATVRGTYQSKGFLTNGTLLLPTPPPDATYRGKLLEVQGVVQQVQPMGDQNEYPTVTLETPTDSLVDLHCYFGQKKDAEVKKLRPGTHIVLAGSCSGRQQDSFDQKMFVRLDNCYLVYSTAPTPPTPRVEAGLLLREYEEDLRLTLVPLPDASDKVDASLTVAQLNKELASDPKAAEKYWNKVVSVSGLLARKNPSQGSLLLTSGQTDHPLKVFCLFSKEAFRNLPEEREYQVRGLITSLDQKQVRLDNCTTYDPEKGKVQRLTEAYLPHTPGKALTYDLAMYSYATKKPQVALVRQIHYQEDKGLTEMVVTNRLAGQLPVKSILEPGDAARWLSGWTREKKAKDDRVTAGAYQRRLSANLVEIGHPTPGKEQGKMEIVYEPALKLRAREGDSWTWEDPTGGRHEYLVEKFTEYDGQPAVIIQETLTFGMQPPQEIRHVYVRNVGEVERQHSVQFTKREKRVLGEKKLISDGQVSRSPQEKKPVRPGTNGAGSTTRDTGTNGPAKAKEGPKAK